MSSITVARLEFRGVRISLRDIALEAVFAPELDFLFKGQSAFAPRPAG